MAQHDYNIANASFPSVRSDINSVLDAINSSNSGTSRPTSAVAGTIWLDTTSATTPTLKFYDGADDISLATLDYSANTVNWLDSTVTISSLSQDLDVNGNSIISSANGNITFTPDGTGKVIIDGLSYPSSDGTTGQFLKTDGAGNLSFDTVTTAGTVLTTQGDILYRDGSGLARLGAGTSGQVLQTNGTGSNPSWVDAGGGITEVDQWRLTADLTNPLVADITANLERVDDATFAKIGTGMTESSGIFSFPVTGLYLIRFLGSNVLNNNVPSFGIKISTDSGSTYDTVSEVFGGVLSTTGYHSVVMENICNVTNISTFRVKFSTISALTGTLRGDTAQNETHFTFIRLGDSI